MKRLIFFMVLIFAASTVAAQDKPAYVLYQSNGKEANYKKMLKQLQKADIILFGELHNNPIAHWLQLEITQDLYANGSALILGAEMLEADNQNVLNQFLMDSINQKALDTLARLWTNYKTDYAPLVNFAKQHQLPFIATNIPRRYASMVYKAGFEALDSLSAEEKDWIAPLPIKFDAELPQYQKILEMMGDHGSPKLVMAQAIKDATMAHFILENYKEGHQLIHYNGAFHSDYYEGILWYLQQQSPDLIYVTISTVSQQDLSKLESEYEGKADYIIVVDEDMTTTY